MEPNIVGKAVHIVNRVRGKRFNFTEFSIEQKERGIIYYLYDKGVKDPQKQHGIIRTYAIIKRWEVPNHKEIIHICILIQQDFPSFKRWLVIHLKQQSNVQVPINSNGIKEPQCASSSTHR